MWALNSWAVSNLAVGVPMSIQATDPQSKSFHQMNAGWDVVNVALATPALIKPKAVDPKRMAKLFGSMQA